MLSTFLLIDDSKDDAFRIQRTFLRASILNQVWHVRSVEEAKRFLDGEAEYGNREDFPYPSVVFLGLRIPGKNGEIARWMKGNPKHHQVRVVMLTGDSSPGDGMGALESGADAWLSRQSHFDHLVQISEAFGGNVAWLENPPQVPARTI